MPLIQQWTELLQTLSLPDQPRIVIVAPDHEVEVLSSLRAVRPQARVTALELWRDATAPRDDAVPRRWVEPPFTMMPALEGPFELVLLDHCVDDVVLSAIAAHEGLELRHTRGEYEPVVRATRAYWRSGDLEAFTRPALEGLVGSLLPALTPSGAIILRHAVVDEDLLGQPLELYSDYLSAARSWLLESQLPLREIALEGYDPHWWMRLARRSGTFSSH